MEDLSLMRWNWQKPEWPEFRYNRQKIVRSSEDFTLAAGKWIGAFTHLGEDDRQALEVALLSTEALETSLIEGEILDRNSVQSSIQRQLGLKSDGRRVRPSEQGIAELMVNVYRHYREPLTHKRLFSWHRMVMRGRSDIKEVGCYRSGGDPMRIVSGPIHAPDVHFEAPPAAQVPAEMERFIDWFEGGKSKLHVLERAALAHLYFESIHPFEDGNGRIGRAIAEFAVSQTVGEPVLLSLSQTISRKKKRYYEELAGASRALDVDDWISYFAETLMESGQRSFQTVAFILGKARLMEQLRGRLNPRQEKALLRVFAEGIDGFRGGLSSANYRSITRTSPATATRDLTDLVAKGALIKTGTGKNTRYRLPENLSMLKENGGN